MVAATDRTPVPILVFMGTAGCGKTSVAEETQKLLQCEYFEGDQLHPAANVEKMSRGEPLDDDDRWPWLRLIRDKLVEKAAELSSQPPSNKRVILLTCSSLRKAYRDILREVSGNVATLTFVYLEGSRELLQERIAGRKGHFMAAKMLDSQLATLEVPDASEQVIVADIRMDPPTLARWVVDEAKERGVLHDVQI